MKLLNFIIAKKWLILFLGDIVIILSTSLLTILIGLRKDSGIIYLREHLSVFLLSSVVFLVSLYVANLYDFKKDFRSLKQIGEIIISGILASIVSGFLIYGYQLVAVGERIFPLYAGMVIFGIIIWRYVYTHIAMHPSLKIKAVVIGIGDIQKKFICGIKKERNLGINVLGLISTNSSGERDEAAEMPILGKIEELEEIIEKYQITKIIVEDRYQITDEKLKNTLMKLSLKGVRLTDIPTFFQKYHHRIPIELTSQEWLYQELKKKKYLFACYSRNLKRLIDLIGGGIGFIFFLFLFIPIAIAIKLNSKGPVFYRQKRVGKGTKPFWILKFRTMIDNAEKESGAVWATENDPRITLVGRFLRRTRIDEFPQFLNILKGEMSLVGPRPEREEFVNQFLGCKEDCQKGSAENNPESKIPYYSMRFLLKPGITGWAQIKQGYVNSYEGSKVKLEYDLYYILNHSFFLDIGILLKSIKIILLGKEKIKE